MSNASNIVCAAERPSIAGLLSEHLRREVRAEEIAVHDNPDETGSFLVDWKLCRFVLSPAGDLDPA